MPWWVVSFSPSWRCACLFTAIIARILPPLVKNTISKFLGILCLQNKNQKQFRRRHDLLVLREINDLDVGVSRLATALPRRAFTSNGDPLGVAHVSNLVRACSLLLAFLLDSNLLLLASTQSADELSSLLRREVFWVAIFERYW